MKRHILLTGHPGIGKTTLIQSVIEPLADLHPVGFYSRELREEGARVGFELVSLNGRKEILAHIHLESPFKVSKYAVNIRGFENFLVELHLTGEKKLVIIDEIGKMESFSSEFKKLVRSLLDSSATVIATIPIRGDLFIEQIKNRHDVHIYQVTKKNRNDLVNTIIKEIRTLYELPQET
jgi:nucleoside-triphosphatase